MKLGTWDLRLGTIIIGLILLPTLPSCITLHEEQFFMPENRGPLPAEAGVVVGNLTLDAGGNTLSGVLIKNQSRDYLIFFYGNGQSIYETKERLYYLSKEYGLNVICFDYQGYGESTGRPSFEGLMSGAGAIYEYVKKKKPRRLFIFSQSIGTVPCTYLGSKHKFDGIIMEAPFTSAEEAVPRLNERAAFPPIQWFVRLSADEALVKRRPQPVDMIKDFTAPLLVLHGTEDEVFPQEIGKKLFDAAGSKNKVFRSLPGTGHSNVDITGGKAGEAVREFFNKYK